MPVGCGSSGCRGGREPIDLERVWSACFAFPPHITGRGVFRLLGHGQFNLVQQRHRSAVAAAIRIDPTRHKTTNQRPMYARAAGPALVASKTKILPKRIRPPRGTSDSRTHREE